MHGCNRDGKRQDPQHLGGTVGARVTQQSAQWGREQQHEGRSEHGRHHDRREADPEDLPELVLAVPGAVAGDESDQSLIGASWTTATAMKKAAVAANSAPASDALYQRVTTRTTTSWLTALTAEPRRLAIPPRAMAAIAVPSAAEVGGSERLGARPVISGRIPALSPIWRPSFRCRGCAPVLRRVPRAAERKPGDRRRRTAVGARPDFRADEAAGGAGSSTRRRGDRGAERRTPATSRRSPRPR